MTVVELIEKLKTFPPNAFIHTVGSIEQGEKLIWYDEEDPYICTVKEFKKGRYASELNLADDVLVIY